MPGVILGSESLAIGQRVAVSTRNSADPPDSRPNQPPGDGYGQEWTGWTASAYASWSLPPAA